MTDTQRPAGFDRRTRDACAEVAFDFSEMAGDPASYAASRYIADKIRALPLAPDPAPAAAGGGDVLDPWGGMEPYERMAVAFERLAVLRKMWTAEEVAKWLRGWPDKPEADPVPADVAGLIDWAQDLAAGMYENGGDDDGDQMIAIADALARLSRERDEALLWKERHDIATAFMRQAKLRAEAAEARLQGVGEEALSQFAMALISRLPPGNDSEDFANSVKRQARTALAAPARDAGVAIDWDAEGYERPFIKVAPARDAGEGE